MNFFCGTVFEGLEREDLEVLQEAGYSLDELAEVAEQMVTGQLATVHSGDEEMENDVTTWEEASAVSQEDTLEEASGETDCQLHRIQWNRSWKDFQADAGRAAGILSPAGKICQDRLCLQGRRRGI